MLELTLPTMTCGHCVATVTKAIPQARVEIDLGTHLVRVQTEQPRDSIVSALAQAGYEPG
jgi:copper chaperone